jgi:hypothetical protein
MSINHSPELEGREPRDDDIELFEALEPGDAVTFLSGQ